LKVAYGDSAFSKTLRTLAYFLRDDFRIMLTTEVVRKYEFFKSLRGRYGNLKLINVAEKNQYCQCSRTTRCKNALDVLN
jgi:hypothetical protein